MAKQTINIGAVANDGTGSNLRAGGTIVNANFTEVYTAIGNGTSITLTATPTELNLLAGVTSIVTPTNSVALTNKTISGSSNTLSNIGNSSLTNSSFSIRDDSSSAISIALGGTLKLKSNDGITTTVSQGDTVTISLDSNILTETSTDVLTNKSISASTNTISGLTNTNLSGSAGITNANIANAFIQFSDESSTVNSTSLGGKLEFLAGEGINTTVGASSLTISAELATSANAGVATFNTASFLVTTGDVTIKSLGVSNAQLANSSVSIGTSTITLGAAATTSIANLNLTGTSALSGTGTIDLTGAGNKLRFNFANTGSFPNATTYSGQFAVATGTSKSYFASGGAYVEMLSENSSIKDLSDVGSTNPTNGQVLIFNSTTGVYSPGNQSGGGSGTVTSIIAGTGLSGGTITTSGTIAIQNDIPQNLYIDVIGTKYNADASNTYHTIVVLSVTKTTGHIYFGVGSAIGYHLDGVEAPFLNLKVGNTYRFDQSNASNLTHQILFYYDAAKVTQYTTGVTTNGTAGNAGAYTQIVVSSSTPNILFYQCINHGYMGNRADLDTSNFIAPTFTSVTGSAINYGTGSGTVTSIIAGTGLSGGTVTTSGTILVDTSSIFQGAATIDVTAPSSVAYQFNSHYSGNNPTLYFRAGHTYAFNLQPGGSHPFYLQTVSGGFSGGSAYATGLTHVTTAGTVLTGAVGAQSSGVLYIEVPSNASSTIYYVCQNHSSMAGKIILGSIVDYFTGNGSTVAFTINSGRNVNDLLVFVNGSLLIPTTDYTVSGTTLTFVSAPAVAAVIQARYL